MPVQYCSIEDFLVDSRFPVLDVRSPAEYQHAQIPGAHSLPLFTNDERAVVGTAYKQQSRKQAIELGLQFFGPQLLNHVQQATALLKPYNTNTLYLHCWRGGMRSQAMAWLLGMYGYDVRVITGGYKAYRQWALQTLQKEQFLYVLGGLTGTGKTELLHQLQLMHLPTLDLEAMASHKGSAFGHLGLPAQPSTEQFENTLAAKLHAYSLDQNQQRIWVEDEGIRLGNINLPHAFYGHMQNAPLILIQMPFELRLQRLVHEYGKHNTVSLIDAVYRIRKRLGGASTQQAVACLLAGDTEGCFALLLRYYDKQYLHQLEGRKPLATIDIHTQNIGPAEAKQVWEITKHIYAN